MFHVKLAKNDEKILRVRYANTPSKADLDDDLPMFGPGAELVNQARARQGVAGSPQAFPLLR